MTPIGRWVAKRLSEHPSGAGSVTRFLASGRSFLSKSKSSASEQPAPRGLLSEVVWGYEISGLELLGLVCSVALRSSGRQNCSPCELACARREQGDTDPFGIRRREVSGGFEGVMARRKSPAFTPRRLPVGEDRTNPHGREYRRSSEYLVGVCPTNRVDLARLSSCVWPGISSPPSLGGGRCLDDVVEAAGLEPPQILDEPGGPENTDLRLRRRLAEADGEQGLGGR